MSERFGREFLKFEVVETAQGMGYWLDRPWVDDTQRPGLVEAAILAVPHEGDETHGPTFPKGSGEIIERLRMLLGPEAPLAVAIRGADYQELALHSKAWRLPTLFVKYVALPMALNIFANRLDELLPGHKMGDTAELTLIIEGPNHKTLKLQYKGDAQQLGPMLNTAIPRFIDELDDAPASPHQVHPSKRVSRGRD